ncbi:MAG: hypothetical protein RR063_07605 [Anaerovoracaceae bacterium]
MKTEDFAKWMMSNKISSFRTYLGKLERVEQYEGNLDEHYTKDHCAALLAKLTYSKVDSENKQMPKHNIPIEPIRNNIYRSYYDGTRDYKSRVHKYISFREMLDKT